MNRGKLAIYILLISGVALLIGVFLNTPFDADPQVTIRPGGSSTKTYNNILLANSSKEYTFPRYVSSVGSHYGDQPGCRGEICLNMSETGTISLYLLDGDNYERWRAKQPYLAILEAQDSGIANFTFPLSIHYTNSSLYLILVNNASEPKDVTVKFTLSGVVEVLAAYPNLSLYSSLSMSDQQRSLHLTAMVTLLCVGIFLTVYGGILAFDNILKPSIRKRGEGYSAGM